MNFLEILHCGKKHTFKVNSINLIGKLSYFLFLNSRKEIKVVSH